MNPNETNSQAPASPVPLEPAGVNPPAATTPRPGPAETLQLNGRNFESYSSMHRKPIKAPIATVLVFIVGLVMIAAFLYFAVNFYHEKSDSLKISPSSSEL